MSLFLICLWLALRTVPQDSALNVVHAQCTSPSPKCRLLQTFPMEPRAVIAKGPAPQTSTLVSNPAATRVEAWSKVTPSLVPLCPMQVKQKDPTQLFGRWQVWGTPGDTLLAWKSGSLWERRTDRVTLEWVSRALCLHVPTFHPSHRRCAELNRKW